MVPPMRRNVQTGLGVLHVVVLPPDYLRCPMRPPATHRHMQTTKIVYVPSFGYSFIVLFNPDLPHNLEVS